MLVPGALLQNRYTIVRLLGQGGMGAVYEAADQRLGNTVALKETFFTDEDMRRAFEREARLLAKLHHPALPVVSDHFVEGNGQFLVMQFIPGGDLESLLNGRGHPFGHDEVLEWADQLLDALDYLHSQQHPVIHRDIKPQNLKLTERGRIILLDFGLAKGAVTGLSQASTGKSIFGYTPSYAPPEQIHGKGTDARSDLYSLAATLYHLVTGLVPADALTRLMALPQGEPDPLVPADEINADLPSAISDVLQKALSLSRDQRPASAADMRRILREAKQPNAASGDQPTITARPHDQPPPAATQVLFGSADTKPAATDAKTKQWVSESSDNDVRPARDFDQAELATAQPAAISPPVTRPRPAHPTSHSSSQPRRRSLMIGGLIVVVALAVGAVILITNLNSSKAKPDQANSNSQQAVVTTNSSKEVYTPSGLRYVEEVVGTGPVALPGLTVSVLYTASLNDGTVVDRSTDHNKPFQFEIGRKEIIKGWDEGLTGMRAGGRRRLVIPPELAYGATGSPPNIPPNATLIFDIELLDVRAPAQAKPPSSQPVPVPSPAPQQAAKPDDTIIAQASPPNDLPAGRRAPPRVVRKSAGVLAGEATRRVEPIYPPLAKKARVSGSVTVEVTIDENGNVISARPLSGPALLKESAVRAAYRWKFKPTLMSGQPVKVIGAITFDFNL